MNNVKSRQASSSSLQAMMLTALFVAIVLLMAFVPNLGYINLIVIKATTIHIPVILGAVFLGPKRGAFLGGVFGATSFINNTFNPSVLSFAFSPVVAYELVGASGIFKTLFICFVPRILIGVVAYYVFIAVKKLLAGKKVRNTVAFAAAGVAGALTNTILVMGSMFLLYKEAFANARQIPLNAVFGAVMGIVGVNGVPEAIVSGILCAAIGTALLHVKGVTSYERQ